MEEPEEQSSPECIAAFRKYKGDMLRQNVNDDSLHPANACNLKPSLEGEDTLMTFLTRFTSSIMRWIEERVRRETMKILIFSVTNTANSMVEEEISAQEKTWWRLTREEIVRIILTETARDKCKQVEDMAQVTQDTFRNAKLLIPAVIAMMENNGIWVSAYADSLHGINHWEPPYFTGRVWNAFGQAHAFVTWLERFPSAQDSAKEMGQELQRKMALMRSCLSMQADNQKAFKDLMEKVMPAIDYLANKSRLDLERSIFEGWTVKKRELGFK